jgi:SpoVK/Ycf46/Vps4 family AAA+-type ATPase
VALSVILKLAGHWKAVLLLDEADVFLAQRTITDIERNAIVSIFLRELEYYQGILLLTTNQVDVIDEAFQSK